MCGQSIERINARLLVLMNEIARDSVRYHRGWGYHISLVESGVVKVRIGAHKDSDAASPTIRVALYPGDTQSQARAFYQGLSLDSFRQLVAANDIRGAWQVSTNFHVAYRSSNICYPERGELPIDAYLAFWKENIARIRQALRGDDSFQSLVDDLLKQGVISMKGVAEFSEDVQRKNYDRVNICPGVSMIHDIPLDAAVRQDDASGTLAMRLRDLIKEALATWGQPFEPNTAAPSGS